MLERLLALAPRFEKTLLIADDPSPYARFGLSSVGDEAAHRGAPGGVQAALAAARTPWVVAVGCDMPFVTPEVVDVLLAARSEEVETVCFEVAGQLEPLPGAYRACLAKRWRERLSAHPSLRSLLAEGSVRVLPERALRAIDPRLWAVRSLNTTEDLLQLGATLP